MYTHTYIYTYIHTVYPNSQKQCGLKHEALKTTYEGAILPLLLYGAPVRNEAMKYEYNKQNYVRVQRLMTIKIAKAFHTTSTKALRILAGTTPIIIKTEEVIKQHNIRKGKGCQTQLIDRERNSRTGHTLQTLSES